MFSSQLDSTEDVWVNDKIAHVGVNQRCALTHMQKTKQNKKKQKKTQTPRLYSPSIWAEKYLR